MKIAALIPAYNPDQKLIAYVNELCNSFFECIIIVNDGSDESCQNIFDACAGYDKCIILNNPKNMGKGYSLKTGMKYFQKNLADFDGVVTCDADGQHLPCDTMKIAETLYINKDSLIIGCRDFSKSNIPARSSFGNKITSQIFKLLYRQNISDTQTGLRGIPSSLISFMLGVSGNRFEYETNVLISCFNNKIEIKQVPISTIYINDNSSSHFRAVVDSVKIYWVIFREYIVYALSAILSFCVDISIYNFLIRITSLSINPYGIYISSLCARFVSCIFNFTVNKTLVFKSKEKPSLSAVKYFLTVILVIFISSNMVKLTSIAFNIPQSNTYLVKMIVDCLLFCLTFFVEKTWVFKRNK